MSGQRLSATKFWYGKKVRSVARVNPAAFASFGSLWDLALPSTRVHAILIDWLGPLVILGVWLLFQVWILPKLGVPT